MALKTCTVIIQVDVLDNVKNVALGLNDSECQLLFISGGEDIPTQRFQDGLGTVATFKYMHRLLWAVDTRQLLIDKDPSFVL